MTGVFSVGNEELDREPDLHIGDTIRCPHCGGEHTAEGGKDRDTGEVTDLLLFYRCGSDLYLAGVAGKNVLSRFRP